MEKAPSAKMYLYGSRAKGVHKEHSDWDVLILLGEKKVSPEKEEEIAYSLYDLEFDTGEIISPMIYSQFEWQSKYSVTPFYANVMKEGQLI